MNRYVGDNNNDKVIDEIREIRNEIRTLELKLNDHHYHGTNETSMTNMKNTSSWDEIKKIYKMSLYAMWFWIGAFIVAIIAAISLSISYFVFNLNINIFWIVFSIVIGVIGLLFILSFVISVCCSVKIFATDFKLESINRSRGLWGTLSIIFLGWVASLTFAIKAKNRK